MTNSQQPLATKQTQDTTNHTATGATSPNRSGWKSWLLFVIVAAVMIVGNSQLQIFLGKRAQDKLQYPALSFEQALTNAKTSQKPILAEMSAIWCPSCRKLESEVLANPQVYSAIIEDYIFVRVEYETEQGKAIMAKYSVSGFPTLLVLDPEGTPVRRLPITYDARAFTAQLQR